MDLAYFMRERTKIIRLFYEEGRVPFERLKQNIQDGVPPWEPPPFDPDYDSAEPAFLSEWMQAEQTRELIGMLAVSLLADTLKLYFGELERVFGFSCRTTEARKQLFKSGFVEAYRQILEHVMAEAYATCDVRFDVIEQVVLARNAFHHGSNFVTFYAAHNSKTLEKHPNPFFVNERDRVAEGEIPQSMDLNIEVSRERLLEAIEEVEKLADWVQANEKALWNWRRQLNSKTD